MAQRGVGPFSLGPQSGMSFFLLCALTALLGRIGAEPDRQGVSLPDGVQQPNGPVLMKEYEDAGKGGEYGGGRVSGTLVSLFVDT